MTRLQFVTAICGLCTALAACGDPSAGGPTTPGTLAPESPTADATASALTFSGTWRTMPSLSPARWRHAADVLGNSIVVVGGLRGSELEKLQRVDAYNLQTRTWTALKSLPMPLYDVIGATPVHGKLYVAGGQSTAPATVGTCLRTLFVYDPVTNSWSRKADMPEKGCIGVQANILGQLYVFTLYTGRGALFASYNPNTNKWVRLPLNGFQGNHQGNPVGGAINGKFYLTGGRGRVLDVYDPATRMWTAKSPIPTEVDGASAAVVHGKLYVAGGVVNQNGLGVVTDVVEAYDPLSDTWAKGPSLLTPKALAASAWAGGRFFVLDGINDGALSSGVEALSTRY